MHFFHLFSLALKELAASQCYLAVVDVGCVWSREKLRLAWRDEACEGGAGKRVLSVQDEELNSPWVGLSSIQ